MSAARRAARALLAALLAAAPLGCGEDARIPGPGSTLELQFHDLAPLDPERDGTYAAWAYDPAGTPHPLGTFDLPADGRVRLPLPQIEIRRIAITVQPPGDAAAAPSPQELMSGTLKDGRATLRIEGSVTAAGLPLVREPGAHSLFTTSNNFREGYPSEENSGLWFFRIDPENNPHHRREVHLTPLQRGWIYEGWIVHRWGTPDAIWISFGKFRPDQEQLLTSRDNTGSGPFSGDDDFRNGGVEDVPGDEWTSNPFGLPLPPGVTLPIQLDSVDAQGNAVWSMVITIEPASDEAEPLRTERPFVLRPYRDPIGAGPPWQPRIIQFLDNLPTADARITG
ncbi:MAG: anti-sigma factor [Gemmatimonadetes bacterium]|nr:anti-sigma factor [Gemmatimonadota bacterium]